MRMRLLARCLFLAVIALPAAADAQQRSWGAALGAGPSFPMGDLGDEAETGFHLQGSLSYQPQRLPFGLRADLFYQDFDAVEREPSINVSLGGEWYRQLGLMLNATVESPTAIGFLSPYVLVGGGFMREWHDDRTYSGTDHATFNFNVGGGLAFPILGTEGFIEARYLNLFGGEALPTGPPAVHPEVEFKSVPLTLGIRL